MWYDKTVYWRNRMRILTYAKGLRSGTKKPHNELLFAAD